MSNILYPNVTSLPVQPGSGPAGGRAEKKTDGAPGEFDQAFEKALDVGKGADARAGETDLSHVKQPLRFSGHATQRLKDRKIQMDAATMAKVNDAIDKAEAKGVEESLILTKDAALIVSVKNRLVITALDRGSMAGNVFTNIDGAVVV